ncbi:PP2C family protein-serine/threonine phosphatase [Citricoccus muralis]|uniref:Protein phosphatase 2C domain-containing protein n=1 Tax=Citricoccus muralis TaxID=169134 RepID=A0ABY8H7R3_9MICC|nr:protein phosphatase 2C domain-containing protein [Citricoccus muralis]WFP16652.1 protein phosphatase 2C domain-containing protein [Citricoccus muralis]
MPLVLHYAARSDVGRVRSKNDDSAYVGRHLAVVADGMGGHVGGDVASASTVLDLAPLDHTHHADPSTVLADEIQNANLILNDLVNTNPKLAGMGTTCTALLLEGSTLHLAHIGDSRAYRLKDGEFSQISRDHTFVQRLIDEGRLDPSEAETHPHKNVLMRVLGDVDASPELDLAVYDAAVGERWLLCSDGLNAVVPDQVIEQKLRHGTDLNAIVHELVDLTLAGGAPDNVTIVVFEVAESADDDASGDAGQISENARAAASASTTGTGEETVSAALLREDLESRPHELVGAARLATNTDQIPIVTRASTQKRAATLLHGNDDELNEGALTASAAASSTTWGSPSPASSPGATQPGTDVRQADHDPRPKPWRSWPLITLAAVLALFFAGAVVASYVWTQSQFYVGAEGDNVAIYRGVSQDLGPIRLSGVEESTDIALDRLPAYSRQRVESGLPAQDEQHARDIVADLRDNLTPEAPPVATPEPSESGSASADPSESSPSASPTESEASPSPSETDLPSPIPSVPGSSAQVSIGGAAAGAMGGNR